MPGFKYTVPTKRISRFDTFYLVMNAFKNLDSEYKETIPANSIYRKERGGKLTLVKKEEIPSGLKFLMEDGNPLYYDNSFPERIDRNETIEMSAYGDLQNGKFSGNDIYYITRIGPEMDGSIEIEFPRRILKRNFIRLLEEKHPKEKLKGSLI